MRNLNKILVFIIYFLSIYGFGQKECLDESIIGQIESRYGKSPIIDYKKYQLKFKTISQLKSDIINYCNSYKGYLDALNSSTLDTLENEFERDKILLSKYGVTENDNKLKKILLKVIPKTKYCDFNMSKSSFFRDKNVIILKFNDNLVIKIALNTDKETIKFTPLSIIYTSEYEDEIKTVINYYNNGKVRMIYSYYYDYPMKELVGHYGLYSPNGKIIKEINLEKEFKIKSTDIKKLYNYNQNISNNNIVDTLNVFKENKVVKLYDTNYGNLWLINYSIKRNETIDNRILIIKDDNSETLVNENVFDGNIKYNDIDAENGYAITSSNEYTDEDYQGIKKLEKELNKKLIITNDTPFSPKNFIQKDTILTPEKFYDFFDDRSYILHKGLNYFVKELSRVMNNLSIQSYKSHGFEGSSNKSGFEINSKIEKFNFLNSNIILKYHSNKFKVTSFRDNDKGISENVISIEFPKKVLVSYNTHKNIKIKNRVEFYIGNIQFKKNDFDLEIFLTGKFSNDVKVKDIFLYKNYTHELKIIVNENHFKIYINGEDEILIFDKEIKQ